MNISIYLLHNKNPRKWHSHTIHKGSHSYLYSPYWDKFLRIHLLRNLFCKVLFLLLESLAGLKTDKSLNGKLCVVLFGNLLDIL